MNKILFIISIFLFLSCNINLKYEPIYPIDKIEKEIKEDTYKYNYRDYSKFSRELKKLAELREPLVDKNEKDYVGNAEYLGSIYTSLFEKKTYYNEKSFKLVGWQHPWEPSEEDIKKWIKSYYNSLSRGIARIKESIKFSKSYNEILDISIFKGIYNNIQVLIIIKNRLGNFNKLKEAYREFDILFLKEVLAEATKILIYYFPYHYEDLDYLFEDTDKYFK